MVTQEQFINGIISYADKEVMPLLNTPGKWLAGAYIIRMTANANKVISGIMDNPFIKAIDICKDGQIDVDVLESALSESAQKYGKMQLSIPMIGTITFSDQDVHAAARHIRGETR